ncbi:MAG: rhomboid-like protein [Mycobacterium sp.]
MRHVRRDLSDFAPLTWSWLALLFVTTRIQRSASHRERQILLREQSTNLKQLHRKPVRVLFASLLWLDGRSWWPYAPVFAGLLAPAERRLGSARFVAIGLGAHVAATLISQELVARSIRKGSEPLAQARARDIGVSYFVFGIGGWCSGQLPPPWRQRVQLAAGTSVGVAVLAGASFTSVGHFLAFAFGLAGRRVRRPE